MPLLQRSSESALEELAMNLNFTRSAMQRNCSLALVTSFGFALLVLVPPMRVSAQDKTRDQATADDSRSDGGGECKDLTLTGGVFDDLGNPLPDALVWLPVTVDYTTGKFLTAHAKCDEHGQFVLNAPRKWLDPKPWTVLAIVWAYAPGRQIGTFQAGFSLDPRNRAKEIHISLGPATDTSFVVLDKDDRPLAGARVEPDHFMVPKTLMQIEVVPIELRRIIGAASDENGRVKLPAMPRRGLYQVQVSARDYGIQQFRLNVRDAEPAERTLPLVATGKIEGRVVADPPELARGLTLWINDPDPERPRSNAAGYAQIVTDDNGHFAVAAMTEGRTRIFMNVNPSWPVRPRLPEHVEVVAGGTVEVEIPLVQAIRGRGAIRVQKTGEPVAGAQVSIGYGSVWQSDHAVSDEKGRFIAYVFPGEIKRHVILMPDPFVMIGPRQETFTVPDNGMEFRLPPIEVVVGRTIKGRLTDQDGKPLRNELVMVRGKAGNREGGYGFPDENGDFELRQVPPDVKIESYEILTDDGRIPADVVTEKPLLLRVSR